MNILVFLKHVPDLVEELEIADDGASLDSTWLRYIVSEYDDHALEQALLLKEQLGGSVTVMALDIGDVSDALFTAIAKGADRVVRITGDRHAGMPSSTTARVYAAIAKEQPFDLILTGVHAIDDLEGPVAARLAAILGLPYAGVVSGIETNGDASIRVHKEFPGGLKSVISLTLPAVIGIQSAVQAPRYVPIAKIRQASKNGSIEELPHIATEAERRIEIRRMALPEEGTGAEMIEGELSDVVSRLMSILSEHGIAR